MIQPVPWVFIVDDDASVRKSLVRSLRSAGWQTESFPTASAFLDFWNGDRPEAPACLVLDVQLPEIDGLQLQRELSARRNPLPIVFITGHGSIPMTVQAIKSGAVDLLPKPFERKDLLRAVRQGIEQDTQARQKLSDVSDIEHRAASLSPREREVLQYVVSGSLNKQIGRRLGVTEKTIKVHRGQVMRKMQASSFADLVRMAEKIGVQCVRCEPEHVDCVSI